MKRTSIYRLGIGIILLAFWGYGSGTLIGKPDVTFAIIPIALGLLTAIAIIIQLVLRKGIQAKMRKILDSEIEERRGDMIKELKSLVSYLEETKYPSYSESGAQGLEDDFQQFDSIKSKYAFEPKIIKSTILIILSSLILVLFWANPTLWVYTPEDGNYTLTLAHVGLGVLALGLWMILDMLVTSLEIKPWEYEETKSGVRYKIAVAQ